MKDLYFLCVLLFVTWSVMGQSQKPSANAPQTNSHLIKGNQTDIDSTKIVSNSSTSSDYIAKAERLYEALEKGDQRDIALYLDPENINRPFYYKLTILYMAIEKRCSPSIIQWIIQQGADVNKKYREDGAPLHAAAITNQVAICKLLLDNGAKLNQVEDLGTPFLNATAVRGQLDLARLLIERGIDLNSKDMENEATPLHYAIFNYQLEMCQLLLEKGADVNAKTRDGRTPLHWAASTGYLGICKLLLEKKAEVNAKDKYGDTPLKIAERELKNPGPSGQGGYKDHWAVIHFLRENGGK